MQDTITTIINTLKAGMTTGHTTTDDYFVKTWYTGDPLALPSMECPAGAVFAKPGGPTSRNDVFVGEDTLIETVSIRFYQEAVRKSGEASEVAAGMTRLISMFETASKLLRTDPTFGSTFVTSKISNIDPQLPGVAGSNVYRVCEITFSVTSRVLWGQ